MKGQISTNKKTKYWRLMRIFFMLTFFAACNKIHHKSPKGYRFGQYSSVSLPKELRSVTGIAYTDAHFSNVYVVANKDPYIYCYYPSNKILVRSFVGNFGSFEDLCICQGNIVIMAAGGHLITAPLRFMGRQRLDSIKVFDVMLPKGNFKVIFSDSTRNRVYVLGNPDFDKKNVHGYILKLEKNGAVERFGHFKINLSAINAKITGIKIPYFIPSGMAKNPRTHEWYVVCDSLRLMMVTNDQWEVKSIFPLDEKVFKHPQGMTFDDDYNLYVANQGNKLMSGSIIRFAYDSLWAKVEELVN